MSVSLFAEDVPLPEFDSNDIDRWIRDAVNEEDGDLGEISFIFCSDEKLLEYNKKYLNHDFYTDVITFDYSQEEMVAGDVFISLDRVKENAVDLNVPLEEEVRRVMIHGVLHLCGYKDDNQESKKLIRSREDYYLALQSN